MRSRSKATFVAACAAAALAAGCGDDEGEEPQKLDITASGTGERVTYEVLPAEVSAGLTEISFTNTAKDEGDAQLIRVDGEHEEAEVIDELVKGMEGRPVADWFHTAGGVGTTQPGESSTVIQELEPGTHYLAAGESPRKPLPSFVVTENGDGDLPETDAKVIAEDYSFSGENVTGGEILLENNGAQWHHFIAAPILEGKTIEDVRTFIENERGEPPFDEQGGFESTVMDGGVSQVINVDLKPGNYAFVCFVSDRQGGPSHVEQGMVSEIKVE